MSAFEVSGTVNVDQLADEIKAAHGWPAAPGLIRDGNTLQVLRDDADAVKVRKALASHVPNPDFGRPVEDAALGALRAKALQVIAGDGTFTAAQTQKILASIVLRATR